MMKTRMMKIRLIAAALIISSIFAMAASGKSSTQVKTLAEVVLQDDKTGNYLLIDLTTGEYRFTACNAGNAIGQSFAGFAKVSYSGCNLTIRDVSETRMVLGEADLCSKQGRATVTIDPSIPGVATYEFTIEDKNIRDSVAECVGAGK